jgi:hypothetical protein
MRWGKGKYTKCLDMDVAQPQVPPTIVTLPLECLWKTLNLTKRQLSALGVDIKRARPSKGLPTC